MQHMKRFAFTFLLTGVLASLPALAHDHRRTGQPGEQMQDMTHCQGMMGMMHGMMSGGMAGNSADRERPQLSLALQSRAELALTDTQRTTLQRLVERFRGTAEQRAKEIETAEGELAALLKQGDTAADQVEAKVRAIAKLRADLRLERIRTIGEGRNALDAGQRAQLDQIAARADETMGGMRGMGGMSGMGSGMMGSDMQGMEGMDHGQGRASRPAAKQ